MNSKQKKPRSFASIAIERVGMTRAVKALRYIAQMANAMELNGGEPTTTRLAAQLTGFSEVNFYRLREQYELAFPDMPIEVAAKAVLTQVQGRSRTPADVFVIGTAVMP